MPTDTRSGTDDVLDIEFDILRHRGSSFHLTLTHQRYSAAVLSQRLDNHGKANPLS